MDLGGIAKARRREGGGEVKGGEGGGREGRKEEDDGPLRAGPKKRNKSDNARRLRALQGRVYGALGSIGRGFKLTGGWIGNSIPFTCAP